MFAIDINRVQRRKAVGELGGLGGRLEGQSLHGDGKVIRSHGDRTFRGTECSSRGCEGEGGARGEKKSITGAQKSRDGGATSPGGNSSNTLQSEISGPAYHCTTHKIFKANEPQARKRTQFPLFFGGFFWLTQCGVLPGGVPCYMRSCDIYTCGILP